MVELINATFWNRNWIQNWILLKIPGYVLVLRQIYSCWKLTTFIFKSIPYLEIKMMHMMSNGEHQEDSFSKS